MKSFKLAGVKFIKPKIKNWFPQDKIYCLFMKHYNNEYCFGQIKYCCYLTKAKPKCLLFKISISDYIFTYTRSEYIKYISTDYVLLINKLNSIKELG